MKKIKDNKSLNQYIVTKILSMEKSQIENLYFKPLMELIEKAHEVHNKNFNPSSIQVSKLISIKTGACPEDCAYCSQSARYPSPVKKEKLLSLHSVVEQAKKAKKEGATRFCMGAAYREVKDGSSFDRILEMVRAVNKLNMEVCCTLGMLTLEQAKKLKQAGLYAYNHNIDTSPEFYPQIITTRKYEDRLKTLSHVRKAGLTVCTGGILGLGESHKDRCSFIHQLSLLSPPPESVTINTLIPIKGTPLEKQKPVSSLDVARVIAVCRIIMKKSFIRLSAGRTNMTETEQFLCFYAGANSIFIGKKLLTAPNPHLNRDQQMLKSMGLKFQKSQISH